MRTRGRLRNIGVVVLWVILALFTLTFHNHTMWLLMFFMTPLIMIAFVMAFLPNRIAVEGISEVMVLQKNSPLELRAYKRSNEVLRLTSARIVVLTKDYEFHSGRYLMASRSQSVGIETELMSRGIYHDLEMWLQVSDFIDIFTRYTRLQSPQEFVLCPPLNESAELVAQYLNYRLNITTPYTNRETFDIKTIREYVPGDQLNRIDWKLSSKTGALIYREYTQEQDNPFCFVFVAQACDKAEWMLSLVYNLDTRIFQHHPMQFGILDTFYTSQPTHRDYAGVRMCEAPDLQTVRQDAVLFSGCRLTGCNGRSQVYCEGELLIFEHQSKREIIGHFDDKGVLS